MKIAKQDETEEMYQKNLALLTPWLRDLVSAISEEELRKKVEVTYNSEGYPVCRYRRDGICFHITSEHPLRETEAWGRQIHLEDSAEIFLYGCGFGYPLFELFEKKTPQSIVIVFEQDLCLFKSMLYYFDLSPLIQTQKIIFFIGDIPCFQKAFSELFCNMLFIITACPTVLLTFSAARNFKKEYWEIHRYVMKRLSFLTSSIGNSHQDDMTGLRNLLANTKEVLKDPYLSCMKDQYRGVPAFIISNGPSLDKSMPLLKKIQGKALMICAESAIVPLIKNGIKPDIMAALERTKANYLYHFRNRNYSPDIALFALAMVDPHIFLSFTGEKIPIFRRGEGMNVWFNRILGDGSGLSAGASVAHLAVSIAIYLGANPIIFVGQDFAYGPGGVTHSRDAVASQKEGEQIRKSLHSQPTVYVEGNSGEMIPSNQLWVNFRMGMENIISEHPEHHFYNATAGGAKIKRTERAELAQLIQRYCTKPIPYRVNELIAKEREKISAAEREALLKRMIAEVEQNAATFRDLAHETNLKKLECERMMLLCAGKDEEKYSEILDQTYQKNLASFYQYRDGGLCSFFFDRLLCAYFYLFNSLGTVDTQEKRMQIFDLHRQFFRDMRVISQSLAVTLEEAAKSLKASSEKLSGNKAIIKEKQLSLCIITKNEESFFPDCLNDMKDVVDETLVVDLGSDDRTRELAEQAGTVVYRPPWEDDFSKIKNFCMDHAAGKWVLFLQANEAISPAQHNKLKLLLKNPNAEAYLIDADDRPEERTVSSPAQFLRLIRNRKNYRFRYRSFEYIPDEELYAVQGSGLRITHRGDIAVGWQQRKRTRLLQTDLREHPQDGYLRYLKGVELLNQRKYKESAASLELARHVFCGGYLYVPHLYRCLGDCLLSLGRNNVAEEVLCEGYWLFPFYADLLVLRAELYRRLGKNEEAQKDLEACLATRKAPNACVPEPKTDLSAIGKMLEEIRAHPDGTHKE